MTLTFDAACEALVKTVWRNISCQTSVDKDVKEDSNEGAVLALVDGAPHDDRVLAAAVSGARPGQRIVMLRVLPLVDRSTHRGAQAAQRLEPWERMEGMERGALDAMRELSTGVGLWRR